MLVLGSKVIREVTGRLGYQVHLVLLVWDFKERRVIKAQLDLQAPEELKVLE